MSAPIDLDELKRLIADSLAPITIEVTKAWLSQVASEIEGGRAAIAQIDELHATAGRMFGNRDARL